MQLQDHNSGRVAPPNCQAFIDAIGRLEQDHERGHPPQSFLFSKDTGPRASSIRDTPTRRLLSSASIDLLPSIHQQCDMSKRSPSFVFVQSFDPPFCHTLPATLRRPYVVAGGEILPSNSVGAAPRVVPCISQNDCRGHDRNVILCRDRCWHWQCSCSRGVGGGSVRHALQQTRQP